MPRRSNPRIRSVAALDPAATLVPRPRPGWLRTLREQQGLSYAEVAKILGTSRQAYAQLESAEVRGVISLNSLARAAAALGADVVYFMHHRGRSAGRLRPYATATAPAAVQIAIPAAEAIDPAEDEFPPHMR